MNKIKTGSGKRLLTEALVETALPVAYDAAAMPGASVLGVDGQIYTSIKIGESYQWSKAPSALSTGEIFLGVSEPRVNFNHVIASGGYSFAPAIQTESAEASGASIGITRYVAGNGPSYLILAKVNNDNPLENTAVVTSQDVGTVLFMGADGTELIPGAAITATVSGTVGARSVPMLLNFRTRPEGAVDGVPITGRMRVMPNGNVLINNTTGTERLDVTGNIKASGSLIGSSLDISGQSARTTALQETALPILLDATAMPGASVLGSDGKVYTSIKEFQDSPYRWSKMTGETGGVFYLGEGNPAADISRNQTARFQLETFVETQPAAFSISAALIRHSNLGATVGSPNLAFCRSRGSAVGSRAICQADDRLGTLLFQGADGVAFISAAWIRAHVDGAPIIDNVPGRLDFFTRPAGGAETLRLRLNSSGNLLLGNTTGTERLSVTGNAQLTESANSYMIGSNNVVGSRKTGWAVPTGTATRTAFDTSSVTLQQLAERLKALIDDLTSHGLIGA